LGLTGIINGLRKFWEGAELGNLVLVGKTSLISGRAQGGFPLIGDFFPLKGWNKVIGRNF